MRSRFTVYFAAVGLMVGAVSQAQARNWTDRDGRTVEAELVRADEVNVVIRRADGREFILPRGRLSDADLAYVDEQVGAGGTKEANPATAKAPAGIPVWAEALNRALGFSLLVDDMLWDDDPAEVATRLRLRPESVTTGAESWRAYPKTPLLVFDAPAYMLALRSEEGKITGFSMMFTNRGDSPAFADRTRPVPVSKAEAQAFQTELKRDYERLHSGLTAALPKAEKEATPAQRRAHPGDLAVFTVGEHEIILQALPLQMLSLRVQPTERVAPPRLSDEQARQRMKSRVTRRDNGDVVIDRIPMVNQGPKGYCVPATFERLLRYAGIPADMYELAALGGTNFGGGTNVTELVEALERMVRQAGRKLDEVKIQAPTASALARYVDEGRPLLWSMASTPEFNQLANDYSNARPGAAADLKAWAAERKKPAAGISRDRSAAHLCLIIGYNKSTGEIAFSDSWGPQFAERWLPAAAVEQASYGQLWVLGL